MSPKISVIMPVYNAENTLRRSIESILSQSFADFEFIIINEFKTNDRSVDIILNYLRLDDRIKFIQKTNEKQGVAVSLNIGLRSAKGQYIARMDADDDSYPERFEKQVRYLDAHPEVILCGTNYRVIFPDKIVSSNKIIGSEEIKVRLLFSNVIAHPTVMFRREEFIDNQLFYDEKILAEDYDLWIKIVKRSKICNLRECLLDYYYGSGSNITEVLSTPLKKDVLKIIKSNLSDTLGIKIANYDNKLLYLNENLNSSFILQYFCLLREIEEKNNILRVYNKSILAKVLGEHWNIFVDKFYVIGKESIPKVPVDVESESFIELLSRLFNVNTYEIDRHIKDIVRELNKIGSKIQNVIIFGVGNCCKKYFRQDDFKDKNINIVCFCDNDKQKQRTIYMNKTIIAPEQINCVKYDTVLITSERYFNEIKNQLVDTYGVNEKNILPAAILNYK